MLYLLHFVVQSTISRRSEVEFEDDVELLESRLLAELVGYSLFIYFC